MLDAAMTDQLRQNLGCCASRSSSSPRSATTPSPRRRASCSGEIAAISDKVSARFDGDERRMPSFENPPRVRSHVSVRFAGLPMGHEFTSLVLALLWAGGHPPKVSDEVLQQIRELEGDFAFEMYFSLSCHNCPDVVQALTLLALHNPRSTATLIEGGAFQEEVERRDVMAVPATFLERRDVRQRQDERRGAAGQARHRRRRQRRREARREGAVRRADRRRRTGRRRGRRSTPRARASAPASPPSASAGRCSTRSASRTSSRSLHRGPQARARARGARARATAST